LITAKENFLYLLVFKEPYANTAHFLCVKIGGFVCHHSKFFAPPTLALTLSHIARPYIGFKYFSYSRR
jgi:hypothetical protein